MAAPKLRSVEQVITFCDREVTKLEKEFRALSPEKYSSPDAIENLARQSTFLIVRNYAAGHKTQ